MNGCRLCACISAAALAVFCAAQEATAGESTDWIYDAAGVMARFDEAGNAKPSAQEKREAYSDLLDEVAEYRQGTTDSARASLARECFALLMTSRIQEQLNNTGAASQARADYDKRCKQLPERDKLLFATIVERAVDRSTVPVQRSCEIETRNDEIRVSAADYPITDLLRKVASAAGITIKVPHEVFGLVDFETENSLAPEGLLIFLLWSRGLTYRRDVRAGFNVEIQDPQYMASLGERASTQTDHAKPARVENGIKSGYVILNGCYIPPPYKIEVVAKGNDCAIYVNGLQLGETHKLKQEAERPFPLPKEGEHLTMEQKVGLLQTTLKQYITSLRAKGRDAALQDVYAFLKSQKSVTSWKLEEGGHELFVTFSDGDRPSMDVPTVSELEAMQRAREVDVRKVIVEPIRAEIEDTLLHNGLVMARKNDQIYCSTGEEARKRLHTMCRTLEEAVRQQERLCDGLFRLPTYKEYLWTWEVFLNLRHRELLMRMMSEES